MSEDYQNLSPENQEALDGSSAHVIKPYINIKFQRGPIKEHGVNGTTMEAVLQVITDRLEGFQKGPFACEENDRALAHIDSALEALRERTSKRLDRGVEGTNKP